MQSRHSSINVNCKVSNRAGVIHQFSRFPDGHGVASTSGHYWRDAPGMSCHYKNGVNGDCQPESLCYKEQKELTGYNGTWKCPYHKEYGTSWICCPLPGEENRLQVKGTNSETLLVRNYAELFFHHTKNYFWVSLVQCVCLIVLLCVCVCVKGGGAITH